MSQWQSSNFENLVPKMFHLLLHNILFMIHSIRLKVSDRIWIISRFLISLKIYIYVSHAYIRFRIYFLLQLHHFYFLNKSPWKYVVSTLKLFKFQFFILLKSSHTIHELLETCIFHNCFLGAISILLYH